MPWLILAVPPLLWAGNFVVGRAANTDVPPLLLALARHVVALLVLLPFGWRIMKRDLPLYWANRSQLLKVSLSGMVVFNALVYVGLHSTLLRMPNC
ncbi:EamA family transporter [Achromobacter animicus]|uniref:EamA family transporter n=1 Tax=Achromobacter animicus TaxID=1389935 RepID=UPI003C7DDB01